VLIVNPIQRLARVILLIISILTAGTVGYHFITGVSWLDAFYFTVITMSTVGHRDITQLTTGGKIFTIGLIFSGAGILAYGLTTGVELLVDEKTRDYVKLFYNRRRSRGMQNHYIVCGLGRVGLAVAEELAKSEVPFLVLEREPQRVELAMSKGWMVVVGDATDDRFLEQSGVAVAKGLISCVDTDASNLFVVVSARGFNPTLEISARVNDEANVKKFERAGASHVYSPFSLLGRRMARCMTRPRVLEILDLALEQTNYDMTIEECTVSEGSPLAWISLKDSGIRQNFGGVVLSVIRKDHQIVHNPDPDTVCQPGDILVTLGTPEQLKRMKDVLEIG
jgi:voltage-gated potassium channel